MNGLAPREGFDWDKVVWERPDRPVSDLCCYCRAALDEDSVPLRMWKEDTSEGIAFCEACMRDWWGIS